MAPPDSRASGLHYAPPRYNPNRTTCPRSWNNDRVMKLLIVTPKKLDTNSKKWDDSGRHWGRLYRHLGVYSPEDKGSSGYTKKPAIRMENLGGESASEDSDLNLTFATHVPLTHNQAEEEDHGDPPLATEFSEDAHGRSDESAKTSASMFADARGVEIRDGHFTIESSPPTDNFGRETNAVSSMFTNAEVMVHSGTFSNMITLQQHYSGPVVHAMEGSAFPMALLSIQAVSLATKTDYSISHECVHSLPLLIESPSAVYVTLSFQTLYRDMKIMAGPVTLWLFFKMWIQRRAIEHR